VRRLRRDISGHGLTSAVLPVVRLVHNLRTYGGKTSEMGHKRTSEFGAVMSGFGVKADIIIAKADIPLALKAPPYRATLVIISSTPKYRT